MRNLLAVLVTLTVGGFARSETPPRFLPVSALRTARIQAYELSRTAPDPGEPNTFHGRRIRCEQQLGDQEIKELLLLMETAETREKQEQEEAEAEGAVAGGVIGCVSDEYGLRFTTPDGVYDALVMIACQRIAPVEREGRVFVNLNEDEAEKLRHFLVYAVQCR